jgi:hypothetical protein
MNFISVIFIYLFLTPVFSKDHEILRCLGDEEKRLHLKKDLSPIYDLNQRLISELIQIPKVEINPSDYLVICTGEKFSESWNLLELSIKKRKSLFVIPNNITDIQRSMIEGMIEDYIDSSREILLNVISQIQTQAPTPTCLKEEIPELDDFFTEIKYLQEDVDPQIIFSGKDSKIFEKLKNYPLAFEKCRARLKKKLKSKSTERPKKS